MIRYRDKWAVSVASLHNIFNDEQMWNSNNINWPSSLPGLGGVCS